MLIVKVRSENASTKLNNMQSLALPFIDLDIDQDPNLKNTVEQLIAQEVESSGGREKLLTEYLAKIGEKDGVHLGDISNEPKPLKAIDLKRYAISSTPAQKDVVRGVDRAAVLLEYERMQQTNLLLLAQVGSKAWSSHTQLLEGDIKRIKSEIDEAHRSTDAIDAERASMQTQAGKTLQDLNEKWGSLAFSAAMLRGALGES